VKRFYQLNESEQQAAIDLCLSSFLERVCNGDMRLDDTDLQSRIDQLAAELRQKNQAWRLLDHLKQDETVVAAVRSMAEAMAKKARYTEPGEVAIANIASESNAAEETITCPKCQGIAGDTEFGSEAFVEHGEWEGKRYEVEGNCSAWDCTECATTFYILED
jgi:hypothetical protein